MKAMPKWKDLQAKYRKDGLRVLVVATQDPKACTQKSRLGFEPDGFICDSDGAIADLFGANPLPAAFLWSWQGKLLVNRNHIEEVENKIQSWMRETPRIEVKVAKKTAKATIDEATLLNQVRARLNDQNKVTIIATEAERARLQEMKA